MMTLGELLEGIEQLGNDLTIYAAKPWTVGSEVRVEIGDDSTGPRGGLDYLLDVDTAQDVIEAWSMHRDGATPTIAERCEALVYYEAHDAYLIPGGYDPVG